jgi:hypothetical protein
VTNQPPPPPEGLSLLIEVLGLDDTLRLIEARGGTKMWVPLGVNNSSAKLRADLEAEFGEAMARALIRGFGGDRISVPLCKEWRTALYASRGMTHAEIARKVGLHADTVWRRLKRGSQSNRQAAFHF